MSEPNSGESVQNPDESVNNLLESEKQQEGVKATEQQPSGSKSLDNESDVVKEAQPGSSKSPEDDAEDPGVVTMVDVLEDEAALEEDAKAVLGGADEKNCTYLTGGYMKRQPLYACVSCTPVTKEAQESKDYSKCGGVCLACSYQCHEGHELVELYTKRAFRCDCGNKKYSDDQAKCKLDSNKNGFNKDNMYNQNFAGLYCICHRPYPDPEDPVSDEMIQCVICEDWFHGRHLGMDKANLPKDSSYSEMICRDCVSKYPLLMAYKEYAVNLNNSASDTENKDVDVTKEAGSDAKECPVKKIQETKAEQREPTICDQSFFLTEGWRNFICKCSDCDIALKANGLEYLLDPEDTVHHYEAKSKTEGSQYEEGMKALSEMDRVQQVEAIKSYNTMKGNLMQYLKKFASNGKVVRQEDIAEFFEGIKSNKKQKTSEVPKFCR